MDGEEDYSQYTEAELVEMYWRADPRYGPENCAKLGKLLTGLGYVVTPGDLEPGWAVPSAAKLQSLIGLSQPFESGVQFGQTQSATSYFRPSHNSLGLFGPGQLRTDGIFVYLSGEAGPSWKLSSAWNNFMRIPNRQILNVESLGRLVRFEYEAGELEAGVITLELPEDSASAALIAVLPKRCAREFRPQLKATIDYQEALVARSRRTPVTIALVAMNLLVFAAMLSAGDKWTIATGRLQIIWGSNFGPLTTHGQWWRLFTSLFVHFGYVHLLTNMCALWVFGRMVERVYGSWVYLLLYSLAGVLGSLTSTVCHPAANSAGASGAIFGIAGGLVAALIADRSFPADIARPLRQSTFVFLAWAIYLSMRSSGVDWAAHIGGVTSGFLLGLVATHFLSTRRRRPNTNAAIQA